jgi:hypothetical protein
VSKDRELNNILDECLERLITSGETVEQCLERYPEHAVELEPLLRTATVTREVLTIEPSAEYRARARYQLRSEMERVAVRKWWPVLHWQPRWAMVVVVVMVVLLAGGGTVAAADSSMPGTPLYGVKLATENVRLALSSSDVTRVELYAALADRRIAEITYAIEKGKHKQVERVTNRLNSHLAMISRLSLTVEKIEAVASEKAPAPTQDKAAEAKPISETAPQQPAAKQPSATTARPTVAAEEIRPQSARAISDTAARIQKRARLRVLLGQYAITHPAQLRDLLEKAPESAKPAILQAITISVTSYNKALEELNNQPDDSPANENTHQDRSGDSPANGDSGQNQPDDSPADEDNLQNQSGDSPANGKSGQNKSGDPPTSNRSR